MSMKEIIKKVKEATGVGFGMIGWFDIQQVSWREMKPDFELTMPLTATSWPL